MIAGEVEVEALGHLVLDVAPGNAEVEIDGKALAGPSPFIATNLPAGRHEIRVHHEGYQPWVRAIDVPAAELQLPITLVTEKPREDDAGTLAGTPRMKAADGAVPQIHPPVAEVVGALDKEVIRRVVRAHIDEVRSCYNSGLVRDPRLAGRVVVQFAVGPTGAVQSASVTSSTVADDAVNNCILGAVQRWKFPVPEGGGTVSVTYPFVLEAG
ncbi:MAG: TonB family protein [Deltaproteobacteria bacterium]|nr:TonB family protein [Nannocystaceae bacterium]